MTMQQKVILAIFIFISVHLQAQFRGDRDQSVDFSKINFEDVSFGVRISPSVSWLKVNHNDAQADGATLKYGVGIVAQYEINSLLSVVSGVSYNAFGGYVFDNQSLNTPTNRSNYKLNYSQIEIPLGLRINTPAFDKMSYYVQTGATAGFILSANEVHKSTLPDTEIPEMNILALTSPSTVGCFLGIGTSYTIYKGLKLFGEINYKLALSNVAVGNNYMNDNVHNYTMPIEIYPSAMDFSIGLMF